MTTLKDRIEKAAQDFAATVLDAVRNTPLQELSTSEGKPKRGRAAAKAPAKVKKTRKKIKWPKCKRKGCTKNAWRRGNGYCGEHAKKK